MKLLVLIIASDDQPIYKSLQELWLKQFNLNPDITCYFIKCDPNIDSEFCVTTDTIFVKCEESIHYGIVHKTLIAMKAVGSQYDFTLRTNLSSFYIFERLLDKVKSYPLTNVYAGVLGTAEVDFVSGCGFLLSKDIVEDLVVNMDKVWNPLLRFDDLCFGSYILKKFPSSYKYIPRHDIIGYAPGDKIINEDVCHYRIKVDSNREYDLEIRKRCLNHFYPQLK